VATVTIRGSARAATQPDEVQVALIAAVTRATADEAWTEATRRSEALRSILDELGVPAERRQTAGIVLAPAWEYDQRGQQQQRGYTASAQTRVRLESAERLGALLRRAVEEAEAEIRGPWWSVREDNPARLEACRLAAAHAKAAAAAYAEALGLRLGAVVDVREPGTGPPAPQVETFARMAAAPEQLQVEPGELEVTAAVEVTFALESR
jgi:uncharacterized protein YggE